VAGLASLSIFHFALVFLIDVAWWGQLSSPHVEANALLVPFVGGFGLGSSLALLGSWRVSLTSDSLLEG